MRGMKESSVKVTTNPYMDPRRKIPKAVRVQGAVFRNVAEKVDRRYLHRDAQLGGGVR
jgi:hypothetical protein